MSRVTCIVYENCAGDYIMPHGCKSCSLLLLYMESYSNGYQDKSLAYPFMQASLRYMLIDRQYLREKVLTIHQSFHVKGTLGSR